MRGKSTGEMRKFAWPIGALFILAGFPTTVLAEDVLNPGDTAWVLISTALVLFMMIPGLAMFYAGLVRKQNVLSLYMQCFALTATVTKHLGISFVV